MPLAGKTTVAEALKDEGFAVLDMGDVVRSEMEKRDKDVSETGEFVSGLREDKGMGAIAQLSVPYLEEIMEEKESIVITGMRGWNEKERFEEETGEEMEVVCVWASRSTRKERREERQREEDVKGQDFEERDEREIDQGVARLMALSHHLIKNDNISIDELEEKVKEIGKR